MSGYTVYVTYALVPTGITAGYKQPIHCNYIKSINIETDNLRQYQINLNFSNISDFKFLSTGTTAGTGYTANRIWILIQTGVTSSTLEPNSTDWRVYDVTELITGYTLNPNKFLTPVDLMSVSFKAPLIEYDSKPIYNLNYLNYPSSTQNDELCFGDEEYFLGNVSSVIKANVYTMDLSINLSLNEFNSSNNLTWNSGYDKVYISEIGIFDSNKNLVAIGKLNDPVAKDATISRTIVFAIDF